MQSSALPPLVQLKGMTMQPERIDALINECATFGHEVPKDGSIQWMKRAEIYRLCAAVAAEARAAARAEVEPLVLELLGALENLLAAVRGECPGLLDEDRGGSAYLGMDADDVIAAAGAWLSPQVGDKGDGNAHT